MQESHEICFKKDSTKISTSLLFRFYKFYVLKRGRELKSIDIDWVQLAEYPEYEISRNGQLRSIKTGTILSLQKNGPNGAPYKTLENKNGEKKTKRIDELVAETFMHNDGSYSFSDLIHLDGNVENCSLNNLAWDNGEFAAQKYYEATGIQKPKEYFIFYPLIEFPDSQYEINKMGQIRNKLTHRIIKGALHDGYRAHTLRIDKKTVFRLAHIMVAKQFIPNPDNKPLVNHIDENRSNPCIDNLEWVTTSENTRHGTALERGNLGRNKLINEYNLNGRYIRTWKSIKHLSDFFDSLHPMITSKSHNSYLKYVLGQNTKEGIEKRIFANRVFTYYEGDCDDLIYKISYATARKYKDYSLDGIDVPSEYLAENVKDTVDCLAVLQAMPSQFTLNNSQKQAINYALECIKKVKENESVMYRLVSLIQEYTTAKL